MTNEMSDHLRKISSRNGRYWLRDQRNDVGVASAGDELPFQTSAGMRNARVTSNVSHESIIVSIPDVKAATEALQQKVGGSPKGTKAAVVVPAASAKPKVRPAHKPATKVATMATAPSIAVAAAVPKQYVPVSVSLEPKVAEPADIPETIDTPEIAKRDEAVEAARLNQTNQSRDSIAKIGDEIVKCFPTASPSVVMFAGSQATLHTDESCARVAAELAGRNLGRVLLIDSDFSGRRLTKASGMSAQGGLSEVMNIAYRWQDAILKSGSSKLDFMPAGNCPHKRWIPKESLREAVAEIKREYQFVCISVGDAHDSASSTWSEIADGTFLLVSAVHSSDAIAESAAAQLRSEGARLIGCIVADVDSDLEKKAG
jgi:MinD-like ATPase involved in chromosome partitioning or flagellar assembly